MEQLKGPKMELLRYMKPGCNPIKVKLSSSEECQSFSVILTRFNAGRGVLDGKFIHASINLREAVVYLVCVSNEEREKEIEGLIPKKKWKNELKNKPIQEWKCS